VWLPAPAYASGGVPTGQGVRDGGSPCDSDDGGGKDGGGKRRRCPSGPRHRRPAHACRRARREGKPLAETERRARECTVVAITVGGEKAAVTQPQSPLNDVSGAPD
jgi:hypothetical protein